MQTTSKTTDPLDHHDTGAIHLDAPGLAGSGSGFLKVADVDLDDDEHPRGDGKHLHLHRQTVSEITDPLDHHDTGIIHLDVLGLADGGSDFLKVNLADDGHLPDDGDHLHLHRQTRSKTTADCHQTCEEHTTTFSRQWLG